MVKCFHNRGHYISWGLFKRRNYGTQYENEFCFFASFSMEYLYVANDIIAKSRLAIKVM